MWAHPLHRWIIGVVPAGVGCGDQHVPGLPRDAKRLLYRHRILFDVFQNVEQGHDRKALVGKWQIPGIRAYEVAPSRFGLLTTEHGIDVQGGNVRTPIKIAGHTAASATYFENTCVCIDRSGRDPMNRPHLLAIEKPVCPTSRKRVAGQEGAEGRFNVQRTRAHGIKLGPEDGTFGGVDKSCYCFLPQYRLLPLGPEDSSLIAALPIATFPWGDVIAESLDPVDPTVEDFAARMPAALCRSVLPPKRLRPVS